MLEEPLVSIVIPNWNGKDLLRTCLNSLRRLTYSNCELVVVDNASTDGSPEMVRREFPNVKLIVSTRNMGFAAGCNMGIRIARGEIIGLFNNDAVAEASWLTRLVQTILRESDTGVAGGVIFCDDAPSVLWSAGARMDAITGADWRVGHGKTLRETQRVEDVDYLPACAIVFPKILTERVGLLNENYFLYFEELDWTLSMRRLGYKCRLVPLAIVWHKGSVTRRRKPSEGYYHHWRGLFRIYLKHFPIRYMITSLFCQLFVFPVLEAMLFKRSPLLILRRFRAFTWNMRRLRVTMAERKRANALGPLRLKIRIKEVLKVAMDDVGSGRYDF